MKKRNKLFIASLVVTILCTGLLLPARQSFADMGAPLLFTQKVYVSNSNGAEFSYYDYETGENKTKTIPAGTELINKYCYGKSEELSTCNVEYDGLNGSVKKNRYRNIARRF